MISEIRENADIVKTNYAKENVKNFFPAFCQSCNQDDYFEKQNGNNSKSEIMCVRK